MNFPMETSVPHYLQRGCVRCHPPLGDGGGGNRGGQGGTWPIYTGLGIVFLC